MSKVFFMGAGSSAAAGYPITKWLVYAVASYLCLFKKEFPDRVSALAAYLATTYSLEQPSLVKPARLWKKFLATPQSRSPKPLPDPDFMPSIIEILSIMDIAIAEQWSFGPTSIANKGRHRELKGDELSRVRSRLLEALIMAFRDLEDRRGQHKSIDDLARILDSGDAVVTTNWDTLLDEAIYRITKKPAQYGTLNARLVDRSGKDLPDQNPEGAKSLFKLHGSFNWQHCPRCAELYVNTEGTIAPMDGDFRIPWLDRYCHCGAEMDALIITPSFIKRYSNLHLSNIWKGAQKALEKADDWIFVGYSLPDDDLWIRGMLLRAIGTRRAINSAFRVHVVTRGNDKALQRRYRQLFPANIEFHFEGLDAFLKKKWGRRASVRRRRAVSPRRKRRGLAKH